MGVREDLGEETLMHDVWSWIAHRYPEGWILRVAEAEGRQLEGDPRHLERGREVGATQRKPGFVHQAAATDRTGTVPPTVPVHLVSPPS